MLHLDRHPYFTKYTDPVSGVESYIFTEKIAGMHQHFYFSEQSVTKDGKYLWIRCTFPPSRFSTLALVSLDADDPFVRYFPHAGISGVNPAITPEQDGVYFPHDDTIYKVDTEGNVTKVFQLDPEFVHYRQVARISTHCTVSCDGKYMILDPVVGGVYYVMRVELATGKYKVLNNFGRCYNHAMCSPTQPDLFLIDQDWWRDPISGEYFGFDNRTWLMNTEGTRFEPLVPNAFFGRSGSEICHDFWAEDGHLCWVDYNLGTYECDVDTREINHVWKRPLCHSHTTADRKYWVGDQSPYKWQEKLCEVLFYDRETNKEIQIFSALPLISVERRKYHADPHPQFVCGGEYVVSTTTVMTDTATVAITPVAPLIERCRKEGTVVVGSSEPSAPSKSLTERDFTVKMF